MTQSKAISATFDVSVANGLATVKRNIEFDQTTISFETAVPIKGEMDAVTMLELHRRSLKQVIGLLQGMEPPQK